MKRILSIMLLLYSTVVISQDVRFTTSIVTDPIATFEDGINFGLGIEYQMEIMYFKAQAYTFPNIDNLGYSELLAVIGFNIHDQWHQWRTFAGFKAGTTSLDKTPFPIIGFESGLEYYINDSIYIGLAGILDRRMDGVLYDNKDDKYWKVNSLIKFGFIL